MLKRNRYPGILAKAATARPKISKMYFILDLSRFELGLYQTIDMVFSALYGGLWGVRLDVRYNTIYRITKPGKSVIINNRFLVGKTEHLYYKMLKGDKINLPTMPATTTTQSITFPELPTVLVS